MGHSRVLLYCLVPLEVTIYGCYGILVNLAKSGDQLPFLASSCVLLTEVLKLAFCLVALGCERMQAARVENQKHAPPALAPSLRTVLPFSVPALCYCVNNNLAVRLQHHMDPATYMVLGNCKIVTTAVLFKLIMKKELTLRQWAAIGMLTVGSVVNSHSALQAKSLALAELHVTVTGLVLLACYCLISGFSGVFSEYLLKKDFNVSVHYQNGLLYSFGILFNFLVWIFEVVKKHHSEGDNRYLNVLHGYSAYTWLLVASQAACGIIMSLIMKHLNNMVRVFVVSSAPLVTTLLAFFLFGLNLPLTFLVSLSLVCVAIVMYNL